MAVAFRANGHKLETSNSSVAVLPAGLSQNDAMVMLVNINSATVTVSTPSGWTQITGSPQTVVATSSAAVFWKVAGASESAPTVNFSGSVDHSIDISAFTGCDTTNPVGNTAGATPAGSTTIVFPAVTTTRASSGIYLANGNNFGFTYTFSSGPASYAQVWANNDVNIAEIGVLGTQASVGSTGTISITYSGLTSPAVFTIVLQPPNVSGPTVKSPPGAAVAALVAARNIERKAERKTGQQQQQTPQHFSRALDAYLHRRGH